MLRIRLTRTGKKSQPSYRLVVAEHTSPIKGRFVEIVGHYNISRQPRLLEVKEDRISYWISVGAQPTDSVASLLKKMGMDGMDKFIGARNKKKKKKKEAPEGATSSAQVTEAPVGATVEEATAPIEESAPEATAKDTPIEEAKSEEAPTEEATSVENTDENPSDDSSGEEKSE
ncbi:MAG: 30S ribosomal protein S16 [Candidatus Peregrinibacteria bacterium]|nr:30S ribosomal protein S16 [Candidatus Peregrinibacteria bacterium]